jgi:diguanylate cyclase (GGDEF)-like protein
MMMIDFDRFKNVNDSYGHMAGDQVLRTMSRVFQQNMRLVDVVGRYGGEEILILMPETSAEQALAAAERLRKQIEETTVVAEGVEIQVTISIGITGLKRDKNQTLNMMIARADAALMTAKNNGRNRVCQV